MKFEKKKHFELLLRHWWLKLSNAGFRFQVVLSQTLPLRLPKNMGNPSGSQQLGILFRGKVPYPAPAIFGLNGCCASWTNLSFDKEIMIS